MNLSASVIGLAAGLAVAVAASGFWTWFVRYRQLKDRTAAIGWWIILGVVLVVFFLDLYLPD